MNREPWTMNRACCASQRKGGWQHEREEAKFNIQTTTEVRVHLLGRGIWAGFYTAGDRAVLWEYSKEVVAVDEGLGYIGAFYAAKDETLVVEKDRLSCWEECLYRGLRESGLTACTHDIH